MSGPRHLWSGDWELESSAHRDELAQNRWRAPVLAEPEPPAPTPGPRRPTVRDRIRALLGHIRALFRRLRRIPMGTARQRRIALAAVAATLLLAGAVSAVAAPLSGTSRTSPSATIGSRAWLGIDIANTQQGGVMVVDVFPGSPAQAAGRGRGAGVKHPNR